MPDATSYLIAAYVLAALVLLGYGAALLRRLARAARRAEALGAGEEAPASEPEGEAKSIAASEVGRDGPTVAPGDPRPAAGEAYRG